MHDRGAETGRLLQGDRLSVAMVWLARGALAAFLAVLALRAGRVVLVAIEALGFPLDLDYGEGIVLQQALLILTNRAYGDINSYPFIVFHYPPVYHLVVRGLQALGCELVFAGRAVSVVATVATAGIVGLLVHSGLSSSLTQQTRLFGAAVGGLAVFAFLPVALWMPFARVDMLAIGFSMAGLLCAAQAPGSRIRLHFAVLFFVLAVYTKQTSVAAPLAAVLMLLMTSRADGFRMIAAGLALALAALGFAMLLTEGRFFSHLITYNINRYSLTNLRQLFAYLIFDSAFLSLVVAALGHGWHQLAPHAGRRRNRLVCAIAAARAASPNFPDARHPFFSRGRNVVAGRQVWGGPQLFHRVALHGRCAARPFVRPGRGCCIGVRRSGWLAHAADGTGFRRMRHSATSDPSGSHSSKACGGSGVCALSPKSSFGRFGPLTSPSFQTTWSSCFRLARRFRGSPLFSPNSRAWGAGTRA